MDREEAALMLDYFWSEKGDIERWTSFDRDALQREFPEVIKAWDDYNAAKAALTLAIERLQR